MSYAPKVPISVCLIAKNEGKHIASFWDSLKPILGHPDDEVILVDTGSVDDTVRRAQKYGWKVLLHPELSCRDISELGPKYLAGIWEKFAQHPHFTKGILRSFAEARNISFDAAKNDTCFWLDLDDTLIHGEYLRPFIDEAFKGRKGALYLDYEYAHENGACTVSLWRERVVSKSLFTWKGQCHEVLVPRDSAPIDFVARDPRFPGKVKHCHPKPSMFSDCRNYLILRHDMETAEWKDPRTTYYLANAARGLKLYEEAIRLYEDFVHRSGSHDDVITAYLSMGSCYGAMNRNWMSLDAYEKAQRIGPGDPRPYFGMAAAWYRAGAYKRCLEITRIAANLPPVDTIHATEPLQLGYHPYLTAALAAQEMGDCGLALHYAERALEFWPEGKEARAIVQDTRQRGQVEAVGKAITETLKLATDPVAMLSTIQVPPYLNKYYLGTPESRPPVDADVTIWCGRTVEPWGPPSVLSGIGASEKMVVDLGKALVKAGKSVVVYATLNCPEGVYDGVHWRQSALFNPQLPRKTLIVWRCPDAITQIPFRAERLYVWMHDVGNPRVWTPERVALIDKVLFLSNFHRSLHPNLPDDKVYLTRNGIDLERHLYRGEAKEKKIIFSSSPDRGWLTACRAFEASSLADDGWQLHCFYGFGKTWQALAAELGFQHICDTGESQNMYEYEDQCRAACDGVHIINRGRVGWDVLAAEMKTASIWLYPTKFDEISCVSAMEAMAAGCKVVATDHAALAETLQGYPNWMLLDSGPWAEKLRAAAETWAPATPAQAAEHARKFDINSLAQQWAKDLA